MPELRLKLKASAKFAAWAAPQVQQWQKDREFNRVEGDRQLKARNFAEAEAWFCYLISGLATVAGSAVQLLRITSV